MYGLLLEDIDVWLLLEDRNVWVITRGQRYMGYY